jgi:hypothetical protein
METFFTRGNAPEYFHYVEAGLGFALSALVILLRRREVGFTTTQARIATPRPQRFA